MVQYMVMKYDKQTCRQNARVAEQIMVSGITLMRQNIRRRHPGASESEIDHLFHCWLSRSDDGIPGDVAGSVRIREAVR